MANKDTHPASGAADLPEALRSNVDAIMEQAQVFASAWSLVGGRFDNGDGPEHAEAMRADLLDAVVAALAARQVVAPVVDNKTAGHAMLWRQHCDKLDALVTYCPTCCQGFIAQKEMTRDQIIYECGKTAGRAALPPAMDGGDAGRLERERICAAIKAEDDYCVDHGDYMLDSDDCIKIVRGEWVRPDFAIDAARAAQTEGEKP